MHFIPIPSTPKTIFDKVKTDSKIDFNPWPKDEAQVNWLQFNGNSFNELQLWLQTKCIQKVEFVDENTDNARKALYLITATDYHYYKKVSDLFAGKTVHPFPKFTASKAENALAGFEKPVVADQPTVFEVTEDKLTLNGTVTPSNTVNILIEWQGVTVITAQYNFQVPANLAPLHFKPLLVKYLSDSGFTYDQGRSVVDSYIAAATKRAEEKEE